MRASVAIAAKRGRCRHRPPGPRKEYVLTALDPAAARSSPAAPKWQGLGGLARYDQAAAECSERGLDLIEPR
jgi:hypothetical protein